TFAAAGRGIFSLFGITMPAFRIAGGLILWVVAMDMLHGTRSTQEGAAAIAVYGSILLTIFLSWLTLHLGERLVVRMGQTGIRVMTRIMGLLLAAIAV